jgi:hypothetical protein
VKNRITASTALALMNRLAEDEAGYIQEILYHCAAFNSELSQHLLKQLLNVQQLSVEHALFAGRLCSIQDDNAKQRLALFQVLSLIPDTH